MSHYQVILNGIVVGFAELEPHGQTQFRGRFILLANAVNPILAGDLGPVLTNRCFRLIDLDGQKVQGDCVYVIESYNSVLIHEATQTIIIEDVHLAMHAVSVTDPAAPPPRHGPVLAMLITLPRQAKPDWPSVQDGTYYAGQVFGPLPPKLVFHPDEARGYPCDIVVQLQPMSPEDVAIIKECLSYSSVKGFVDATATKATVRPTMSTGSV